MNWLLSILVTAFLWEAIVFVAIVVAVGISTVLVYRRLMI
jgi:hypothetical protein